MTAIKKLNLVGGAFAALIVAMLLVAVPAAHAEELAAGEQAAAQVEGTGAADAPAGSQVNAGTDAQAEAEAQAKAEAEAEAAAQAKAEAEAKEKAKRARKTIADGLYNLTCAAKAGYAVSVKADSKKAGASVVAAARDRASWAQKWTVTWDADTGYYKIRNMNSRMFLGVSGTVKSGASVKQYKNAYSKAQLWEPVKVSGGVMFKSAGSKYALGVKAAKKGAPSLALRSAASGKAQTFKLDKAQALDDDHTYFVGNVKTGKQLAVSGASRSSGAKVSLARSSDSKSQKFRLVKAGSSYRLQNVRSCYFVGAKGASAAAPRQLASKTTASAWNVKLDLKGAAFTIGSKKAGKRLDGKGGKLKLKKASDSSSQLFTFTPTYAFKLYLDPGHGANSSGHGGWDPGAVGNGHTEAEFTHDLGRRVERLLAGTDVQVVNGEKFKLAYWKRAPKAIRLGCDALVSIHFNAGGVSGTLGMVGGRDRLPGSDTLSSIIRTSVVKSLGLTDRGPISKGDITVVNGSITSMLIEVCFIDNAHDVATYLKKRDAVAQGIAAGIVKASRNRAVVK